MKRIFEIMEPRSGGLGIWQWSLNPVAMGREYKHYLRSIYTVLHSLSVSVPETGSGKQVKRPTCPQCGKSYENL